MKTYLPRLLIALAVITFPASVLAQEIRTVIAEGVGSDPQSAAQNAAQNALTNVVGSFIDANKQLEKRVQIANGIRSQTTEIKTTIREYSQGSIQSFEIIDTTKDGSFIRVTAKVAIRLAEFRAYIQKTAEGSVAVDAGLFAEISTAVKQADSVVELLVKPLQEIADGKVEEFIIGKPVPYNAIRANLPNQFQRGISESSHNDANRQALSALDDFIGSAANPDSLIVIPITVKLNKDFLANLSSILESTKSKSQQWRCSGFDCSDGLLGRDRDFGSGTEALKLGMASGISAENAFTGTVYTFAIQNRQLLERLKLPEGFSGVTSGINPTAFPTLNVSLISADDQKLPCCAFGRAMQFENVSSDRPWILLETTPRFRAYNVIVVPERTFSLVLSVDSAVLQKVKTIKLEIAQR